ncbi:hypothetical protein [Halobacterium sp. R2-5]|nr:hypothetical protein [Halobacterium sp. R2-5]
MTAPLHAPDARSSSGPSAGALVGVAVSGYRPNAQSASALAA